MIIAQIASAKKLSVQLALHCHCCYCPFQRWFSYIWELFSHPVIFRKVAHVTKRSATRILRKNVAVMKLLLAGDALLESHLYPSGALLLFEWYFMTPRQTNKHYQANGHFSVLWLTTNHLISPVPPPVPYISPNQNSCLPSPSIPVSVVRVWMFVLLSFATKANGLLPATDTALKLCRVKPNAYLRAQACVSQN